MLARLNTAGAEALAFICCFAWQPCASGSESAFGRALARLLALRLAAHQGPFAGANSCELGPTTSESPASSVKCFETRSCSSTVSSASLDWVDPGQRTLEDGPLQQSFSGGSSIIASFVGPFTPRNATL